MINSFQTVGRYFPELARFQQQLDDLFEPSGVAGIRALARGAFPAINIGSSPDSVEVIAFAPGVDPKEIEITVDRGLLSLSGERRSEPPAPQERRNDYAKERFAGKFRRVVSLPEDADTSKVEASFRDGILHVIVAKRESSKPRRINVR